MQKFKVLGIEGKHAQPLSTTDRIFLVVKLFMGLLLCAMSLSGCQSPASKLRLPSKPTPAGYERWVIRVERRETDTGEKFFTACVPTGWEPEQVIADHRLSEGYFKKQEGEELTVLYLPNAPKDMWDYMLEKPGPDVVKKTSTLRRRTVNRNGWTGQTVAFHLKTRKAFFDQDSVAILLTNKRDTIVVEDKSKNGKVSLTLDDLWKIVDSIEPQ